MDPSTLLALAQRAVGTGLANAQSYWDTIQKAAREGDLTKVETTIEQLRQELDKWRAELAAEVPAQPGASEPAPASPFGDDWWEQRYDEINQSLADSAESSVGLWLSAYVDALTMDDGEACDRLAELAESIPGPLASVADTHRALSHGSASDAASAVHRLLRIGSTASLLAPPQRVALLVLAGRLELALGRPEAARVRFEAAEQLDPLDPLPAVGLGEYQSQRGKRRKTRNQYKQAFERARARSADRLRFERPDPYLALAAAAAEDGSWDDADDYYGHAVRAVADVRCPDGALGSLLAPVDGNAFLRLAEALKDRDRPAALRAVDRALSLGITMHDAYGLRYGHELRAQLLAEPDQAADAYREAGILYTRAGEYGRGIVELKRSIELSHVDAVTYWELADALRLEAVNDPSADPGDKLDPLLESVTVWEQGSALRRPGPTESWAYVVSALSLDALATCPSVDAWELRWQAIGHIERALCLEQSDPASWATLIRLYRYQNCSVVALEASERAMAFAPSSPFLLAERGAVLAEVGQLDEARVVLEEYREQESSSYPDTLLAFVDTYTGHEARAVETLDRVIALYPHAAWERTLRADCLRRLERREEAVADYKEVLYMAPDRTAADLRAFAAYQLGKYELAAELLERMLTDPAEDAQRVWFNLGLCLLAQGETERGASLLRRAIDAGMTSVDRDRWRFEFEELEHALTDKPGAEASSKVLAELLEQLAEDSDPAPLASAESLLRKLLDSAATESMIRSIHATLGRMALYQRRWEDAAREYGQWSRLDPDAPEAVLGIDAALDGMLAEARDHIAARDPERAVAELDRIERVVEGIQVATPAVRARLHAWRATAAIGEDRIDEAIWQLEHSREFFQEAGDGDGVAEVARAVIDSGADRSDVWRLQSALRGTEAPPIEPPLQAIGAVLEADLESDLGMSVVPLPEAERRPTVDLGADLVPTDQTPTGPLFGTYLPEMRARVLEATGVNLPGILFRHNPALGPGGYAIRLNEFIVAEGEVPARMPYAAADAATLGASADEDGAIRPRAHPVTGQPGAWVAEPIVSQLESQGVEVWTDPLLFVVAELEAALRRLAAEFLDFDQVDALIDDWGLDTDAAAIIAERLERDPERVRFARVLRALFSEGVPLTNGPAILAGFNRAPEDLGEAVREIRLALSDQLADSAEPANRVPVPEPLDGELARWAQGTEIPPKRAIEMLNSLRPTLEPCGPRAVLVTRSSAARPLLRRLISGEFPDVRVMSTEEIGEAGVRGASVAGEPVRELA